MRRKKLTVFFLFIVLYLDCIQPLGQRGFTSLSRKILRFSSCSRTSFFSLFNNSIFSLRTWAKRSLETRTSHFQSQNVTLWHFGDQTTETNRTSWFHLNNFLGTPRFAALSCVLLSSWPTRSFSSSVALKTIERRTKTSGRLQIPDFYFEIHIVFVCCLKKKNILQCFLNETKLCNQCERIVAVLPCCCFSNTTA